jgi:hypothetical protein
MIYDYDIDSASIFEVLSPFHSFWIMMLATCCLHLHSNTISTFFNVTVTSAKDSLRIIYGVTVLSFTLNCGVCQMLPSPSICENSSVCSYPFRNRLRRYGLKDSSTLTLDLNSYSHFRPTLRLRQH